MKYVLDTNILLIYLRNHPLSTFLETQYDPFSLPNIPIVSVVSVGEIQSLALRNNWGRKRVEVLNEFLNELVITSINSQDVIQRYAEIDAYSQVKLFDKPLDGSSRNMGKNDLWIASTASVAEATLITADSDFHHLDGEFLDVIKVDL